MKILFILSGNKKKASSRVRGYWIAQELEKENYHCVLKPSQGVIDLFLLALRIKRFDVVVFQKTYSRYHKYLLLWAKLLKVQTVLDIDDAPSRVHSEVTLANFQAMAKAATMIFAGSPKLVNYVSSLNKQVLLIPSSIPMQLYSKSTTSSDKLTLAWIGNGKHYAEDLIQILKPALTQVAKQRPIHFKLIGALQQTDLYKAFEEIEGLEVTIIDQLDWADPAEVSNSLDNVDIGLYPLLVNDFNSFKCGFKALEYLAKGIPVISSDVAINAAIVKHNQNGIIVKNNEDWREAIMSLVDNNDLRHELGGNGRQFVMNEYTVEKTSTTIKQALGNGN